MSDWRSRITTDPGKLGGMPCVRGMRISVADVLEYLASGMTIPEILADFPYLEREDILACLAYAAERERERGAPRPNPREASFRRKSQSISGANAPFASALTR
jgi:uncharacterized protein (DUF433 family)